VAVGSERSEKESRPGQRVSGFTVSCAPAPPSRSNIPARSQWLAQASLEALDPEACKRAMASFNAAPARHAWNFLAARQFH
jgi:hypothetical protein